MICSLCDFPSSPKNNEVFVCSIEGILQTSHYDQANPQLFTSTLFNHPGIQLNKDIHPPSSPKLSSNKVFLPCHEPLAQKIRNAWWEGGLSQVLEVLSEPSENFSAIGQHLANICLSFIKTLHQAQDSLARKPKPNSLEQRYKGVGPVVCMSWHPQCSKIAIVTCDDSVHLYSCGTTQSPVLKSQSQRNVTAIAWRPLTSCEIAVACSSGVYLWCLDPNLVICNRPSISSAVLYQWDKSKGVSTMAWSPNGDVLATGSLEDTTLYLWEVEMKRFIPLKRVGRGGISLLSWSPDNTKLISATTTDTFRIWETEWWESEVWTTAGGDVVAAVWSMEILLFATYSLPYIYAMPSASTTVTSFLVAPESRSATRVVVDCTRVTLQTGETIGGEIVCMSWDKKARHLAVLFRDCEYVVVFVTDSSPQFTIAPGFLVKGRLDEIPSTICFQENFKDGANLTIAWSTGRIQYFPLVYKDITLPHSTTLQDQMGMEKNLSFFGFASP